jgi:MFS family permease
VSPSSHALWQRPGFRRFWSAHTASAVGTEVTDLALPTIAIVALGASPAEVGALVGLRWLAFLIAGLPAGMAVDRMPRRWLLVLACLARVFVLCIIPFAWYLGRLDMRLLFVVAALIGLLTVIQQVADRSYVPELIDRAQLLQGNARLTLGQGLAKVAGPSIAGPVIQVAGGPAVLVIDAATNALAAWWLAGIRGPAEPERARREGQAIVAEVMESFRFVFHHRLLRPILTINTLGNFGAGIVEGVALVFAYRTLRLDAGAVGLAMAIGSIGFLATAMAADRITHRLGMGRTLAWSCLLYGVAPFALLLGPQGYPIAAVALWRLLYGTSLPPYDVNAATIRQVSTPDRLQGRTIGVINMIGWGALGLGPFAGGVLAERFDTLPTIVIGGTICLIAAIPAFVPSLSTLHGLPLGSLSTPTAGEVS